MRRISVLVGVAYIALATTAHGQGKGAGKKSTADTCANAAEHAQLLRMQGKWKDARAEFLSCAKVACPAVVRRDCDRFAGEIEAALPTVTVVVHDARGNDVADAKIEIDGAAIEARLGQSVPLDPGPHAFHVVTAEGALDKTVVVQEGDKNRRLELSFPAAPAVVPPPSSKPEEAPSGVRPILGWGLIGLGVAGAAVGTIFAIAQADAYAEGETCLPQPACGREAKDSVDSKRLIAGISFGVGAAALVGGVVLLLTQSPSRAASAARLRWEF